MNYLALCCIVKDEDPFLSEWFIYHALAGVEHFYIYDNDSAVSVKKNPVVLKLLKAGRATLHKIEGQRQQYAAYEHCFNNYRHDNFWIGALDLDEFLYLARPEGNQADWLDFRAFLAEFEDEAGLGLNWNTMASSGHLKRPQGLVTDVYREKLLDPGSSDYHIKTILQASCFVSTCANPHNFAVRKGSQVVNENHHPIPPKRPFFIPFHRRAWIYHYFFKSQEDFEIKASRGRADIGLTDKARAERYALFQKQTTAATRPDARAAALAPLLRQYLDSAPLPPLLPEPQAETGLEGYFELCQAVLDYRPGQAAQPAWAAYFGSVAPSALERYNRAEALLCRATFEHGQDCRLWVQRAKLARQQHRYALARRFLDKALSLGENFTTYEEWFQLALAEAVRAGGPSRPDAGKLAEAAALLEFMRIQPGDGEGHAAKMNMYGKMLNKLGG